MFVKIARFIFWALLVRPFVLVALGLNVVNRERLEFKSSSIIAANHNSHLDALVLMSLMPLNKMVNVRPVAAADYFMRNAAMAWFSLNILRIIPLDRTGVTNPIDAMKGCEDALDNGDMLILFPEGSRGEAESISQIKKGIFHLSKKHGRTVIPVLIRGLGATLPKGKTILVPFNCDVVIGEPISEFENADDFVYQMENSFKKMSDDCITQPFID